MKYFTLSILMILISSNAFSKEPGLSRILKQHADNVLTPDNVADIPAMWAEVPENFSYIRNWRNLLNKKIKAENVLRLSKSDGEKFYFDFEQNGTQYPNPIYIYINGMEHKSYDGKPESNSELYGECKFVLGKCTFSVTKTKSKTINTIFEEGKWIRTYAGHGGSPAKSVSVYDRLGLELYRYYEAKNSVMAMKHVSVREM